MKLTTVVAGQRVALAPHAVQRYCERFKHLIEPTEDELDRAAIELLGLLTNHGEVASDPPWDLYATPDEDEQMIRQTVYYLVVGGDICIPAEPLGGKLIGLTVLARGSISSIRRAKRNARKQEQRDRARARRQNESWRGEKAPRWS